MDVKTNFVLALLLFCIYESSSSPQRSQISSNPEILGKVQGLINQVRNLIKDILKSRAFDFFPAVWSTTEILSFCK